MDFDTHLNKLYTLSRFWIPHVKNGTTPVPCPDQFNTMKEICKCLAKGLPFVRNDLYSLNSKIYFGETTFYTAS